MTAPRNPLTPSPALLARLGSIAVHAEEALGEGGHPFDAAALRALLTDQEVLEWLSQMQGLALLPVKR